MGPDDFDHAETSDALDTEEDRETRVEGPSPAAVARTRVRRPTAARYRLTAELGHGGMGEVIAARDEQIGRDVAIKRMRAVDPTPRQTQRFMREACIQGRLEHPAIVPVHELGRDVDGRPFFAMKKLAGTTLAEILDHPDTDRFPRQRLLRAFAEVCLAIELAHTRGVVHRDLKPDNIMLGDFGEVYVIDWGVAKVLGDAAQDVGPEPLGVDSAELVTVAGAAIGTPGYMSPEQVRGDADVGPRSDVYALGSVLFEILTGDPLHPRGGQALQTTVHGIDASAARRAPDREIAPELDALCVAATQLSPARRIASARELGDGVQRFLDGDRDLAQRRELARVHLGAATAAYALGGVADRAVAMREAGRALALDPTLAGAGELVTRLMLEPPRDTPPEVEAAIEADTRAGLVATARVARWAFVSYTILIPRLLWTASPAYAIALAVLIAVNGILMWRVSPTRPPAPLAVYALGNFALLALVAHLYTPLLLAPGLAAMTGLVLSLNPPDSALVRPVGAIVLLAVAVIAPWGAEAAGLIPRTVSIDETGFHLFGAGVLGGGTLTAVTTGVTFIVIIAVATLIGSGIRNGERASRRRLHLQAWQLRQLVP